MVCDVRPIERISRFMNQMSNILKKKINKYVISSVPILYIFDFDFQTIMLYHVGNIGIILCDNIKMCYPFGCLTI